MAAPSTVYSSNVLKVQQGSGTPAVLALLPLSLTEYGSDVNMKALFYLDEVKHCLDVSGKDVIQALVKDSGANYLMHAPARLGMGRYYKDGQNYILLNDGGLNTYAYISVQVPIVKWANYTKIIMSLKSSYYSSTSEYGVYYRVQGTSEWIKNQAGYVLDAKLSKNDMRVVTGAADHAGVTIEIKGYVINEEGELQTPVHSYVTDDAIVFQLARAVTNLYTKPSENSINFFMTQSENAELGHIEKVSSARNIQVYADADMTTLVADGLYNIMYPPKQGEVYSGDELGAYNGNKAVVTVSGGTITKWEEGLWSTATDKQVTVSVRAIYDTTWGSLTGYILTVFNNGGIASLSFPCEVWLWKLGTGSGMIATSCISTVTAPVSIAGGSAEVTVMAEHGEFPVAEDEIAIGILPSSVGYPDIAVGGPALLGKQISGI